MEKQDKIIKCLAYNKNVSIICANTTIMVEKARKVHDLSPVATAALGRILTITAIMGSQLKNKKDKITVQIKGNGPLGQIVAVTDNFPKVKAYVQNPYVDIPLKDNGKLDVGGAVGNIGFLNVIKDIGLKEPYIGMVQLVSGEIAEDFTKYFATSEQTPSVVALGVLVGKDGVITSGGYKISLMPNCKEEEIEKIENAIKNIKPVSKLLEENLSLKEIAVMATGDNNVEIIEETNPIYECDCSKEKMEKALISLGKEELEAIIKEDGKAELVCNFCNQKYLFRKEELESFLTKNIEKKR